VIVNFLGPVAALTAFLSVWFGHVAVRKIEFNSRTIWLPAAAFAIVGIIFEWFSLFTSNFLLSTASGILGITLLFDAFEFVRQQKRIIKGHAPANPNNPRHAQFMREYASVTSLDLLERDPIGKPVSHNESVKLITEH
jgi:uncharacterized protein DUF4491